MDLLVGHTQHIPLSVPDMKLCGANKSWVHMAATSADDFTSRRASRQADDPARDVASAAAGDAGSMSKHSHVPAHGMAGPVG